MKTRLFSNWRSSLLGLFLLIIAVILLFTRAITLAEFSAFFPTILSLLYVQDSIFQLDPSKK